MNLMKNSIINKFSQVVESSDDDRNTGNSNGASGVGGFLNTYLKFNWTVSKLLEILFITIICIGFFGNLINIYIFSKRNM